MTRDEIKTELARFQKEWGDVSTLLFAEYIAQKAVAKEREACAQECEAVGKGTSLELARLSFAEKIRARSDA